MADAVEVPALVGSLPIQSLQVAIIEQALGAKATDTERSMSIGGKNLPLDPRGRVPCSWFTDTPARVYGIDSLLARTIPPEHIHGKVIILGYGRKNTPTVGVAGKAVPIHTAL